MVLASDPARIAVGAERIAACGKLVAGVDAEVSVLGVVAGEIERVDGVRERDRDRDRSRRVVDDVEIGDVRIAPDAGDRRWGVDRVR